MESAEALYRRFLDGDNAAFEDIVRLYRENLIFFLLRTVDIHTAEDIAEDAFVELLLHPKRFNFSVSLKTYLFSIARHKAATYKTKRGRETEIDENASCDEPSVESFVADSDEKRRLYEAVEKLPKDKKSAVWLFYFENQSYAEIAKVMGKKPRQIESMLVSARSLLKQYMES